ncbi:putative ATPase/DNA-binding winged helix-turn-helix (wHTH) protein [Rhizobium sp. SG_E_25_P2]|uniref:ATP-binding protein n=1 Tax=Rhizobium sp. SG_E_25_P2 TaxID=2879942 RepID=UPI0024747055|nr:winged helix-turn-helix domain-containing protein [Rhizobium sp. SG_E_25_P2]MDH6265408.1 putative ATPase/DNA-binding winged helix-turn-helix (wHTH) protein [Rhizobium sp. SG_E_25_P2]
MGDNPRASFFAFGPHRLYPVARILTRDGLTVQIGSRAFDMLVALVERQGEVVSRRELMNFAWPGLTVEDSNVRVQIAHLRREIHCGENGERYVVSVAGRGYSFVASAEWREMVDDEDSSTAPPRVQDMPPYGPALPARLAKPIGREENLVELVQMIGERRFVTVVGAGGVGKTTLVVLAAQELKQFDRVHFVDLSLAETSEMILQRIAVAMGLEAEPDIRSRLVDKSHSCLTLLIVDNCEHLLDEVAQLIGPLLQKAPKLHIVATSREAFRLPGETVYLLKPLAVPPPASSLSALQTRTWPAVRLFIDRAIDGGYQDEIDDERADLIAALCRRLDGNPLAIELVASRTGAYGLERVSELLDNQMAMCWRGSRYAPLRQQNVQSMLDWSYACLSETDQIALRRLSIFTCEFSLDAALAVAGGDGIEDVQLIGAVGNLVDKFLLVFQAERGPALFKLPGITRMYAANKLTSSGERGCIDKRHAAYERRVNSISGFGEGGLREDAARASVAP